jgi:hypothetical protein
MLVPIVYLHARLSTSRVLRDGRQRLVGDAGQTTAEYALVLIGAAALAVLLIGWASKTDAIGKLFDQVMKRLAGNIGG